MPAKDLFHDVVVQALVDEGWTITDDPLWLSYGDHDFYVDLGAERSLISAERGEQKIAVEIKTFVGRSQVYDLERAIGQYDVYRSILEELQPDRQLYLAVPQQTYENLLTDKFGRLIVDRVRIKLIVFTPTTPSIIKWIP